MSKRRTQEWLNKPRSTKIEPRIVEAIARRRRQILIHACMYYMLDSPIIDDSQWDHWAQQLVKLQRKFGWRIGFYDEAFQDFDASTGYHLPFDADVVRVARRVHDEFRHREFLLS